MVATITYCHNPLYFQPHTPNRPLSERLCQQILSIATLCAIREGMVADAAEDCGLSFVAHIGPLCVAEWFQCLSPSAQRAWLWQCANNWVRSVRRHWRVVARIEAGGVGGIDSGDRQKPLDDRPSPEALLLRGELIGRILAVSRRMDPRQQALFEAWFLHNASIQELAQETGRTPAGIRQSLYEVRRKMREFLSQDGLTGEEIEDYLCCYIAHEGR